MEGLEVLSLSCLASLFQENQGTIFRHGGVERRDRVSGLGEV